MDPPAGGAGSALLRAAFRVGVALYAVAFVAGGAWAWLTHARLPSLRDSPLTLADEAFARGDVQKAAREYRMVSRIDASNYDTPKKLAEMLSRVGDASGEIDQFRRATELWPRDPATHRRLGWAYLKNQRFEEAQASLGRALALAPGDGATLQALGETLIEMGRYDDAVRVMGDAVRALPGNAAAVNSLGVALALAGRNEAAVARFEEAVRLDPQPSYAQNLERARGGAKP